MLGACTSSIDEPVRLSPKPGLVATASPTERSPTRVPPTNTRPAPSPTTQPSATQSANGQEPVVILQQEGGFAGVMASWSIYQDGRIVAEGSGAGTVSGEFQVEPGAVSELIANIEETGFYQLQPAKLEPVCCDFFVFTLTVQRDGRDFTMAYSDGDQSAPESLQLAVGVVQSFLSGATADSQS